MYSSKKGRNEFSVLTVRDLFFFINLRISFHFVSFYWIEFEKYLRKRDLSADFEKELEARKKEEKKMRKREKRRDREDSAERKRSTQTQNQRNKDSSNRYVCMCIDVMMVMCNKIVQSPYIARVHGLCNG